MSKTNNKNTHGTISGIDKPVSRIFYGTAGKPFSTGKDASYLLDAMLDKGVNAIDTARVYGRSEESIGHWFKKSGRRHEVVLLTKAGHPSLLKKTRITRKDIRNDIERSMRALHTDYIDILLLHRDNPDIPVGEVVEWLNEIQKEGKILTFGASNWTVERIREANTYAEAHSLNPFSASSPGFSLAVQKKAPWSGCVALSGPQHASDRRWYADTNFPVIAYSSLAGGFFSGRFKSSEPEKAKKILDRTNRNTYLCDENLLRLKWCEEQAAATNSTVSQIALAWIFAQSMNTFAVVSTTNPDRMQQNLDAL